MGSEIVGHNKTRQLLANILSTGKLHSAILLSGAAGIGKSLVAKELAAKILCRNTTQGSILRDSNLNYSANSLESSCSCNECNLVKNGNHPDLFERSLKDKEQASTEAIRELLDYFRLKSFMANNKVIILRDAELLPTAAANTLLKTLEEPTAGSYFILTTANPARLPHTVVSRCQRWYLDPLSTDQVMTILARLNIQLPEGVNIAQFAEHLDGSLDQLAALAVHAKLIDECSTLLSAIVDGELLHSHNLISKLGRDKEIVLSVLSALIPYARRCMHSAKSSKPNAKGITQDLRQFRLRWALVLEDLLHARYLIAERNLSVAAVLSNMLINAALDPCLIELNSKGDLPTAKASCWLGDRDFSLSNITI